MPTIKTGFFDNGYTFYTQKFGIINRFGLHNGTCFYIYVKIVSLKELGTVKYFQHLAWIFGKSDKFRPENG